ncbi:MAG: ATP-binding protein [Sandaracinaceae bacterium]
MSNVYRLHPERDGWSEVPATVTSSGTLAKEADDELRRLRDALADRDAELSLLAHVVSHDLRAPLRAITGFGELLQDELGARLEPEAADYLERMTGGAERLQSMIDALVRYLRLGPPSFETVDLGTVVESVLADRTDAPEIELGALPRVEGDPAMLTTLLEALIDNGLKFADPDRACRVHVGARLEGERWVVEVRDTGIGFEPHLEERARAMFVQLHPRGRFPGLGFGLALAAKILALHDSELWFESVPGEGTTVRFHLAPAAF